MSVLVQSGPYLTGSSDFPVALASEDPKSMLDEAQAKIADITGIDNVVDPLKEDIQTLSQNTETSMRNVPDFKAMADSEQIISGAIGRTDSPEPQNIVDAIELIRNAFLIQRYKFQTREITEDDRINFAKVLVNRIDPITKDGKRTRHNPPLASFAGIKDFVEGMYANFSAAFEILKEGGTAKVLNKVFAEGQALEAFDLASNSLKDSIRSILTGMHHVGSVGDFIPRENFEQIAVVSGGFSNAIAVHFAMIRVGFEKLAKEFDVKTKKFQEEFVKMLRGVELTMDEFMKINANTLKLIENENGVISNQEGAYVFDADNFEMLDKGDKRLLIPTLDFMQRIISKANDNDTTVKSRNKIDDRFNVSVYEANFADEYRKTQGCPFMAAKDEYGADMARHYYDEVNRIAKTIVGIEEEQS